MAVLLSDGRKNLKETFHHILDTFHTDIDCSRGIFIKPNIVFPVRPGSNEITPPLVTRALIMALRERYCNIDIVIGEGVAAGCDPPENFETSGYAKLAHELNVPLLDLNSTERISVPWKFGKLELPSVALERTYINLPILKPSSVCVISGGLKNQKGLLPPAEKKRFHRLGLHEQIAELNSVVHPSVTIMDCRIFFGRNTLISGNNCGEIDATACHLLGIDEPDHVQLSRSSGVFTTGYSINGDKLKLRRASPHLVVKEFKRLGQLRLWSNPQACTGCRYIFRDIQNDIFKGQNLSAGVKLLPHSIKGAEIIMGKNPQWRQDYLTVICVGECTRRVAREGGFIHIPGCPPTLNDLNDNLP
jgi:uncharacterized protein (DUF362 family)